MTTAKSADLLANALRDLRAEQQRSALLGAKLESQRREIAKLHSSVDHEANSRLMAEVALDDSQDRLRLAVEAAKLILWEWDIDTGEVFLSERWSSIVGGPLVDRRHSVQELLALVHPEDLADVRKAIRAAVTGESDRYVVEHRVRGSAGWVWLESHGLVTGKDMLNRSTRMIGTHANVSARKLDQVRMRSAQASAELASQAKSDFLANMSHEIRTPLNGIIGLTALLLEGARSEEQAQYLKLIDGSAQALLGLVNDVLDFSKIDADKMVLESIPFGLQPLLDDIVGAYAVAAKEKGLSLSLRYEGRPPSALKGDPGRLRQVLSNLLSNAVKFTDRGEVELAVIDRGENAGRARIRFEVADTGKGVSAEKQARIFEAFHQEEASTTRKYGGTGLGLAICDRLARLMGGALSVVSLQGKGSVFSLEVELEPVADVAVHNSGKALGVARAFEGLRVLLAEDHAVNELLMRRVLDKLGCVIQVARNGREAVHLWGEGQTDLILMDVQMPEVSGLDATATIRKTEAAGRLRRTPIVALTAYAMAGDREKCLEAGMDAYVSKPVNVPELMVAMEAALKEVAGHEAPPLVLSHGVDRDVGVGARRHVVSLDTEKLLTRVGGDRSALRELVVAMRSDMALRLDELGRALNTKDAELAHVHAHALRGALASITAERAAMLTKGLETAARHAKWSLFQRALPMLLLEARQVDQELASLLGTD
jgi:signal transduction histidine kinase/CheY-like chemotaxis protein/HPt (histidine-containing phosphotransfer) domain-containing protein